MTFSHAGNAGDKSCFMFAHTVAIDYTSVIYVPYRAQLMGVINFRCVFLVVSQNDADLTWAQVMLKYLTDVSLCQSI